MTDQPINDLGALAAALAKAQSSFPAINRDKEVTVQTKTGGSYKFKYAPLDSILAAVRAPLADNGLAIAQLLDDGELVTMLLHKDGARLSGRVALPNVGDNVQALGSAITYLRRYSLQAMLGIAAEEDDDGNRAAGNTVKGAEDKEDVTTGETLRSLGDIERSGAVAKGSGRHSDLEWRQTPDGYHIGFLLEVGDGKAKPQVSIEGPLAVSLYAATAGAPMNGMKVTVKGELWEIKAPNRRTFYRIVATSIETDEWRIPSDLPVEAQPSAGAPASVPAQDSDLSDLPDEWKQPAEVA